MAIIDPAIAAAATGSADPYANQPIGGGINNIGSTINALTQGVGGNVMSSATGGTGGFMDYLTGGGLSDLFRTGGQYYLGQENIQDVRQMGRQAQEGMAAIAQQAREGTQFKPYTVTSTLGGATTTPEGGFGIQLSPEQQALQQQLQGQAAGLFGQVGLDPAAQQQAIYEQIRATQMPEEERQRLALEERMLSQGRMGISSAAYGGSSPELLAQETARQEAMGRASLGARQQALAEQQQALSGATGLMGASYQPQQQALSLLQASQIPAGFADIGRRTGTQLGTQAELGGLESRMQAEELANQLRLGQQSALLQGLLGQQTSVQDQLLAKVLNTDLKNDTGLLGGLYGALFGDKG